MECGGVGAGCRTGSEKPVVAERKKNCGCYDWSHDAIGGGSHEYRHTRYKRQLDNGTKCVTT